MGGLNAKRHLEKVFITANMTKLTTNFLGREEGLGDVVEIYLDPLGGG